MNQASASNICTRTPEQIFDELELPQNRIAFQNDGGLIDGGVCWWHSRLQRSSIYLATYAPELPKPTWSEAKTLVENLIHRSQVIQIPGYSNFSEFSKDFEHLIQHELNQWQLRDGFIEQQWIRGLRGRYKLSASKLKQRMNGVYANFKASKPGMWVMAQMKGVTSHALLIIGMKKTDAGYQLRVIDSNQPSVTRELEYKFGDHSLILGSDLFVPYVGFQKDQRKIDSALAQYCQ